MGQHQANSLRHVTLSDKYALDKTRAYMTGIEALVRLPMLQHQRDLKRGLNTAGFVSGYRGSPLGGVDQAMWQASAYLQKHNIHFQPGVNEELAATAVLGSQQTQLFDGARYDGVFGMWYGKGPGVDRSMDVFKHANAFGTAAHGGVLAIAGDDHACKSSTLPHQSEHMFIGASIPVLAPSNVQEVLDLGIFGWELSRFSGSYLASVGAGWPSKLLLKIWILRFLRTSIQTALVLLSQTIFLCLAMAFTLAGQINPLNKNVD